MHTIPLQRYAGPVMAQGVYGRRSVRLSGRGFTFIALALVLLGLAWANGFELAPFGFFLAGPVTLAQAKLNVTDALNLATIDEFRKESYLLDRLTFDQAVNPAGGGATLTYGYQRVLAERSAAFRAINAEYTPTEATKQRISVDLKPLGGSFQIDRVLAQLGPAAGPVRAEVAFQVSQLVKAARAFFQDQVINGDSAVDANAFDGLSKALAGSTTEVNANGPVLDLTTIDTKAKALAAMARINAWLGLMDGEPDAILANKDGIALFTFLAAWADQLDRTTDAFGRPIQTYRGIPLINLGAKAGSSNAVIGQYPGTNEIQRITITGTPTGGTFTLTFAGQTTAAIAFNAAASAVVTALEALPNIDSGDVAGSGGALPGTAVDITFQGRYAGINVPLMTINTAGLTGGTPAGAITTPTAGGGAAGSGQTGLTDLYAVRFGLDGFHAVAVPGPLVQTWLPDFNTAGAVKTGEAELGPVAPVLKSTKAAAVVRNVKVA